VIHLSVEQRRFIKFLLVGVLNTLFGYAVFALFVYLGFHYSLASLLSTILGVLFNFRTTGRLVFNNRNNSLLWRFAMVYTVVYGCNVGLLRVMDGYSINMYVAGAVAVLPLALLSYFLNKRFVFEVGK
jgi:putative flippase GtrA